MKELSGTARNFALVKNDDEFRPVVELIFIVSEPAYKFAVGEMVRERIPETIRIGTNHGGIKKLLEVLMECDKEFELLERQAAAAEMCGGAKAQQLTAQACQPQKDAASTH